MSIGFGVQNSQQIMLEGMGDLTLIQVYSSGRKDSKLDDTAIKKFQNIANVDVAVGKSQLNNVNMTVYAGDNDRYVMQWVNVVGINKDAMEKFGFQLIEGSYPKNSFEVLAGQYTAYNLMDSMRPDGNNTISRWDYMYSYDPNTGEMTENDSSALPDPYMQLNGQTLKLELYSPDELSNIIIRSAGILDQPITPEGAYELAKCSRGTPRVANRFLKRVRDFATVLGDGVIDRDVALLSLKRMDVDALGLDELDRSLLRAIIEMYNGGPVGLETLAAALGEEAVTLEDLCEPYLMQMGFLTRTPRGRCATRLAYEHLGLKAPESGSAEDNGQQSLF